jgi:hypothetical protein
MCECVAGADREWMPQRFESVRGVSVMSTPNSKASPSASSVSLEPAPVLTPSREHRELAGLREHVHELETRNSKNDTCNQLLAAICQAEILASICEAEDLKSAGAQVARELQKRVGGKRAAIGLTRLGRGNVRLLALSDVDRFSPRSEVVRKFEAAMDEAVWQGELIAWPTTDDESHRANHAHRHLSAALNNATVVTIPLLDHRQNCWGAIVLVGVELPDSLELIREFAAGAGAPISAALGLWKRSTNWRISQLVHRAWKGSRRRMLTVAGFFLLGLAIWPFWACRFPTKSIVNATFSPSRDATSSPRSIAHWKRRWSRPAIW